MIPMNAAFGFLPQIGPLELGIILVIVIIILGPKRIPAAARSVGRGFRNFKGELGTGDDDEPAGSGKTKEHEKSKTGN